MVEPLKFDEAIKLGLSHLQEFDFNGRSRRSEYWYMALVIFCVSFVAGFIPFVGWLISIALSVVSIFFGIRRFHDIGKSGLYMLLVLIPLAGPFIVLYYMVQDSVEEENDWGPSPKYSAEAEAAAPETLTSPADENVVEEAKPEEKMEDRF